nr:nitric oxide reductase activation protein NorD [Bdellovibrio sp. CKG001]
MDITEKIYEAAVRWKKRRQENELESCRYHLQDCDKALALVLQPFFDDTIEIHAARQSGVMGRVVYLPESIHFFPVKERNRDLYLHQALYLAASQKLKIHWPELGRNAYARALHFVRHKALLHSQISKMYPSFPDFHQSLLQDFLQRLKAPANAPGRQMIQLLSSVETVAAAGLDPARLKRNEPFPEDLWLLWGGLSSVAGPTSVLPDSSPPAKMSRQESELSMQTHFEKEEVDLDKEEHNPVTHSFEKMETVDEYQGGSRVADGSDQLQEHSEALKEIQPRHVTRSGEEAASFFKSDFAQGPGRDNATHTLSKAGEFFYYPEWHFKRKQLLPDFCRLKVTTPEPDSEGSLREQLLQQQSSLIERSRRQLDEVRNQRKWRGGQLDGPEVDLDAYVRHLSDVRNRVSASGHLYQSQFLRQRDMQILILLDFSLSTDSYVANHRVLDIELESVGLWGLLQTNPDENTIVAGTYSETRHHCAFEFLKKQDEKWDRYFSRVPNVVPRGYTRLGPAIRHATQLLQKCSARQKVLLLLTDGKPTDYDGYEGRYGIEDMRKACLEAETLQISTKAFAIEKAAKHYFPQMFYSYEILSEPAKLPESLIQTLAKLRR